MLAHTAYHIDHIGKIIVIVLEYFEGDWKIRPILAMKK